MDIALGENHWYQQHQANAVIKPITGKETEVRRHDDDGY
jgi:hypothetical protein